MQKQLTVNSIRQLVVREEYVAVNLDISKSMAEHLARMLWSEHHNGISFKEFQKDVAYHYNKLLSVKIRKRKDGTTYIKDEIPIYRYKPEGHRIEVLSTDPKFKLADHRADYTSMVPRIVTMINRKKRRGCDVEELTVAAKHFLSVLWATGQENK